MYGDSGADPLGGFCHTHARGEQDFPTVHYFRIHLSVTALAVVRALTRGATCVCANVHED